MRVLLVPVGSRGDVQPLLALGQRLRSRGHSVLLACSPDFGDWGRSLGFEVRTYGPSVVSLSHQIGEALRRPLFFLGLLRHHFVEHFRGVHDNAHDCDVIVGGGAQGAMTTVAEWRRIPCFYVAYCPQILPSPEYGYPPMPVTAQNLGRTGNALAWWATMKGWELGFGPLMNAERKKLGLAPAPSAYHAMFRGGYSGEVLVAADPVIAPAPPATADLPITQTGPFFLEETGDAARLPDALERFVATPGPPIVYFGFGSMVSEDPDGVTATIVEAAERAGVRALISAGWAELGAGALPKHCMTIGPVSHAALFPRIAAAVHHGGAGTTHAVARAGIPQVIVPHLLDQFFWGARIERAGLGARALPMTSLRARPLADAIRAALAPSCAALAKAHGERIRRTDGLALAVEKIEQAHARNPSRTGRRVTTA